MFLHLCVIDNLSIIFEYHPYWKTKKKEIFREEARRLLDRVGLSQHHHHAAGMLSGGQKRKLEVVRALLMHPHVLLCDEPFAGVDPKSTAELSLLFKELTKENRLSILLSDHNVRQLLHHADYVYMVLDGTILAEGTSDQIRSDHRTREQYLGDAQV